MPLDVTMTSLQEAPSQFKHATILWQDAQGPPKDFFSYKPTLWKKCMEALNNYGSTITWQWRAITPDLKKANNNKVNHLFGPWHFRASVEAARKLWIKIKFWRHFSQEGVSFTHVLRSLLISCCHYLGLSIGLSAGHVYPIAQQHIIFLLSFQILLDQPSCLVWLGLGLEKKGYSHRVEITLSSLL